MRVILALSIVLLLAPCVGAQTTRPVMASQAAAGPGGAAPAAWERAISSIAAAAAGHDAAALQGLLASECVIRRFSGERDPDSGALADFLSGQAVLGDHAYVLPQATIAEDVAADVTASALVADTTKKALALDEKGGSSVALRWASQTLEAEDGTPIGVIVLWAARSDADNHQPNFVLIKGTREGGNFRITSVVYGDPLR